MEFLSSVSRKSEASSVLRSSRIEELPSDWKLFTISGIGPLQSIPPRKLRTKELTQLEYVVHEIEAIPRVQKMSFFNPYTFFCFIKKNIYFLVSTTASCGVSKLTKREIQK